MITRPADNIEIIAFNHFERCRAWVDKFFDYYVIQFAQSGSLELIKDHKNETVIQGPVVWLSYPGPYFQYGRRDGGEWDHRFVAFKGRLADDYAANGLLPISTPVIKINDPIHFAYCFDRLLTKLSNNITADFRTIHQLEELMLQLSEQPLQESTLSPLEKKINDLKDAIEKNPEKEWDWPRTACRLNVSYPHFRKVFQAIHQYPPARFLMQKKIEKAALLLRSNKLSIDEIADCCGFYDLSHFSRSFGKYMGTTPGKYRKRNII